LANLKSNRQQRPLNARVSRWLHRIWALPAFSNEETNQLARTYNILLVFLFLAAASGAFLTYSKGLVGDSRLIGGAALLTLLFLVLMRLGLLRLSIFLSLIALLALITLLLYRGGFQDLALIDIPVVIVIAGLLVRPREFLVIFCLTMLSVAAIVHLEIQGVIRPPTVSDTSYFDILSVALILTIVALAVRMYTGAVQRSLERTRLSEQAVVEREERYRRLIEASPDGIAVIDLQGAVVSCNQKMADMLGLASADDLTHRHAFEFIDVDEHENVRRHLEEALQTGLTQRVEYWFVRADRSRFLGELCSSLIQDPQHKPLNFVTIVRDITERKKTEEQRRLLESEVRQIQKLESLGTLAGGIAHDFNNILSIIIGHIDLLQKSLKDQPKEKKALQTVSEAAERGAALVKQILTFARKSEADFKMVDVSRAIDGLVKLLETIFPRTIVIESHIQPDLPRVFMDPAQLHQALLNLCINARDAMASKGKLTLCVDRVDGGLIASCFPDAAARRLIRIRIIDTGTGLDEETRGRIFDPFFTTKDHGKGTGLGLSVVYGVVQTHRGFIEVESQPGRGTTFVLYFPVSAPRSEAEEKTVNLGEVPSGHEMVLLVEDEESLRELLSTALLNHGYEVITARDGLEALDRYRRHRDQIGLIITDMDLPKINGAAVSQSILSDNPGARIILISGFLEAALKSSILASGVREFMAKPYTLAHMLQVIRKVLDEEK